MIDEYGNDWRKCSTCKGELVHIKGWPVNLNQYVHVCELDGLAPRCEKLVIAP